jgi:REP element-mobilizing transposase RayT
MPQSLANLLVHLTFSTKHRQPTLKPAFQQPLCGYMIGILKNIGSPSLEVNCVEDHAHILFLLSKTRSLSEVVEDVKTGSSKWLKTQDARLKDFHWQAGYGAFSVSQSSVASVCEYIVNQQEHHRRTSFQDEFRAFLTRHGVEFDERYVWD